MKTDVQRVHISGASGCGVTTLGKALAQKLSAVHLDTDDFYWLPTDPPYREKRPESLRVELLKEAFSFAVETGWVLCGALGSWGAPLAPFFKIVVFLHAPTEVRLERLRAREALRFGAEAVAPGGWRHAESTAFLEWAAGYDTGSCEGRSRPRQEAWLAQLPCPVLRLDSTQPAEVLVQQVVAVLQATHDAGSSAGR